MTLYTKVIIGVAVLLLLANAGYLYTQYQATIQVVISPEKLQNNPLFIAHKDAVAKRIQEKADTSIPAGSFSLGAGEKAAQIFEAYYNGMKTPSTFRVKIFDRNFVVLWSNLPEVIGKRFPDDDLKEVMDSGQVTAVTKSAKDEQVTEGTFTNFSEVIVPVKDSSGKIVGVAETYQSMEDITSAIQGEFTGTAVKTLGASLVILILVALGGKFLIH